MMQYLLNPVSTYNSKFSVILETCTVSFFRYTCIIMHLRLLMPSANEFKHVLYGNSLPENRIYIISVLILVISYSWTQFNTFAVTIEVFCFRILQTWDFETKLDILEKAKLDNLEKGFKISKFCKTNLMSSKKVEFLRNRANDELTFLKLQYFIEKMSFSENMRFQKILRSKALKMYNKSEIAQNS